MAGIPEVVDSLSAFSTDYKKKWYERFKASSNYKGTLSSIESLNTYKSELINNISALSEIKAPDGVAISEKLNSNDVQQPAGRLNKALNDSFKDPQFDQILAEITNELKELSKLISAGEFSPSEVASYLLSLKGDAVAAIDNKHAQTKAKVEEVFTNNADDLKVIFNCNDEQLQKIKTDYLAKLDQNKADALKKLEEALETDANALFDAAKVQYQRIAFIADRFFRDKEMKEEIKKQMGRTRRAPSIAFNADDNSAIFKDVDIKLIKKMNPLHGWFAGTPIEIGENTYSVKLNRIWESEDSILKKISSLAQTIKATGSDTITLKFNNRKDPEKAESDARLGYEAAIMCGFDPKKITIEVNDDVKMKHDAADKTKSKSDLFAGHGKRLQYAESKAVKIAANIDKVVKGTVDSVKASNKKIKDRLHQIIPRAEQPQGQQPGVRI